MSSVLSQHLAVILVDMQKGFFGLKLSQKAQDMVAAQIVVIRTCAIHDIPLIILEIASEGATLEVLEEEIRTVPRVIRIRKWKFDGFTRTNLDSDLKRLGTDCLLFTGVNASECVLATARSARRLGYEVTTARTLTINCCGCPDDEAFDWYSRNGTLLPSERDLMTLVQT